MTTQTIEAVFENGVFRPLIPLKEIIPEGQAVTLVVESPELPEALVLLSKVYDGLSEEEIDEIEKIMLDRSNFFRDRPSL